jgi:hypothetical protein
MVPRRAASVALILVIVSATLAACTVGSRRLVTEEREVQGIDEVVFATIGELTIEQAARESLSIEAESNVLRRIRTEVRGGTLYIEMRDTSLFGWGVVPTRPVRYTLVVRALSGVDLSGVGSIHLGTIEGEDLDVRVSGAGKVVLRSLSADDLTVEHSGVGLCELSGRVRRQQVALTGAGEYDAAELESDTAEVAVTGLGKATVWVHEDLQIRLSGAGAVHYYGRPQVDEDISGAGRVKSLGSR